jgi:Cu2+-exporting ATPase
MYLKLKKTVNDLSTKKDMKGNNHHKHMAKDFARRFWIALAVTLPLLVLSTTIQSWLGYELDFKGRGYVVFGLATFLFFYGGWPFLKGIWKELNQKQPGMMTLIALAITVAYVYSSAIVFGLEGKPFFWELSTLVVVMLAGHWIEMKSVARAGSELEKIKKLMPEKAHKIQNGDTKEVPAGELKEGDKVLVKPGERIPIDGKVYEGSSSVDESVITGETEPVTKEKDDGVTGGSINGNSSLKIVVSSARGESYLSRVINMVEKAKRDKSRTQHLADKAAFWLTLIAITVGSVTLAGWLLAGRDFNFALSRMVTVMVIAISTSRSAKNGLLIRNRTAFENTRKIDLIIFDKTGTLTMGEYSVSDYDALDGEYDKKQVLEMAAALEKESEHPIAKGILDKAKEMELDVPAAEEMENLTGEGVKGKVSGKEVKIVSPAYIKKNDITLRSEHQAEENETLVYVLSGGKAAGYIALSDKLRETSGAAIKKLRHMGIESWILSGDTEKVTKYIAQKLEMEGYFAEVLPDEKQDKIKELQKKGRFVAMTGDGVNDAPALAQADVGIAIGSGTDVAAETADIVLVNSDPLDVVHLIRFGKATHKKMIQNLVYATAYNAVALPLGAGAFYWAGVMISPAVGAILMSLSTVAVAVNAQFLKRKMKKSGKDDD